MADDREPQPDFALSIGRRGHHARDRPSGAGPGHRVDISLAVVIGARSFRFSETGPLQQDGVESASRGLLANLSLLFVPAGVGVVQKLDLLAERGIAIILVLAVSVVVTLLVTVATFVVASRLLARGRDTSTP